MLSKVISSLIKQQQQNANTTENYRWIKSEKADITVYCQACRTTKLSNTAYLSINQYAGLGKCLAVTRKNKFCIQLYNQEKYLNTLMRVHAQE